MHTHTHTYTHALILHLSLSLVRVTLAIYMFMRTRTHTHSLFLFLSLSLSHAHTHTRTRAHDTVSSTWLMYALHWLILPPPSLSHTTHTHSYTIQTKVVKWFFFFLGFCFFSMEVRSLHSPPNIHVRYIVLLTYMYNTHMNV